MLKRSSKLGLAAAIAGTLAAGTALATPIAAGPIEMYLQSGTATAMVTGTIPSPGSASIATYVTTTPLNGWTISLTAISFAPTLNTDVGIDLGGIAFTCAYAGDACSSAPLTIAISAPGFNQTIGQNGFLLQFGGTINGGALTTSAWWDTSESYFCDPASPGTPSTNCGPGNLIGTLSLGSGSTGATLTGGPDPIRSYSLTVADVLRAGTNLAPDPFYSVDTSVVQAVPEPGTLALFVTGLFGVALISRRRRTRTS